MGTVIERYNRLSTWDAMDTGLHSLGRPIEVIGRVPGIDSRSRPPDVMEERWVFLSFYRSGQVGDRISKGAPARAAIADRNSRLVWALGWYEVMVRPVVAGGLAGLERARRMTRLGNLPIDAEVGAEGDDHHALPYLRYSVIRGIDRTDADSVAAAWIRVSTQRAGETGVMFGPTLLRSASDSRQRQAADDVVEVGLERRPQEPTHVLAQDRSWTSFTDHPNQLRKEVPAILVAAMNPAQAEGLAGWATGNHIDFPCEVVQVESAHVALYDWPAVRVVVPPIRSKSRTGSGLKLAQGEMSKADGLEPQREPTGAGEQLQACAYLGSWLRVLISKPFGCGGLHSAKLYRGRRLLGPPMPRVVAASSEWSNGRDGWFAATTPERAARRRLIQ